MLLIDTSDDKSVIAAAATVRDKFGAGTYIYRIIRVYGIFYVCIWDMTHLCKWGVNPVHMGHDSLIAAAATVRDKFGAGACVYGT